MKSMRRSCTRAFAAFPLAAVLGCSSGEAPASRAEESAIADREADLLALADLPQVTTEDLTPKPR
jgi:hypothetical protein